MITVQITLILLMFFFANQAKHIRVDSLSDLALILLIFSFSNLFFRWDLISVYLKYVFLILAFINWTWIVFSNKRIINLKRINSNRIRFFSMFPLLVLNIILIRGCFPDKSIDFDFPSPLACGNYYVVQGGTPPLMNRGHSKNNVIDRYSIDLVKINKYGRSLKKQFPNNITDYNIYNDSVFSPCNGKVVEVKQETNCNFNLTKPNVDYKGHRTNNIVIIKTGNADLILAHLKKGSIIVKVGEEISVSDYIGLVCNAGAVEPHLHIQLIENGQAIPFMIDGKYLHNNSIIRN